MSQIAQSRLLSGMHSYVLSRHTRQTDEDEH